MPKRKGFLYEWMCDKERIRAAIIFGSAKKKHRRDVQKVLADIDGYTDKVLRLLTSQSYVPCEPKRRTIYDPSSRKMRTIEYVPFYPDGIIQTLMVMALEPTILRGMNYWCCASVPNRGGKHAMRRCKRVIHHDKKGSRYVCKMDVHHFYHSIDRRRLIWMLAHKVKDKKFLKLTWDIIQTCEQGLAIGFFICQWLANFYLESLDRYITTLDGVKHTVRYMDDIVLFGSNKKKLHRARKAIAAYLENRLRLQMKGNWQVFPLKARALDFVGYRFYRSHTTMRRRNFLRFARQCRKVRKRILRHQHIPFKTASGLLSRIGQLKHCNSAAVRRKYVDPIGVKVLKEVVRNESKRRQCTGKCVLAGGAA